MLKKYYFKSIKTFIILLILFGTISSAKLENRIYASAEGAAIFDSGSNENETSGSFVGYTRMASTLLILIALIIGAVYVLKKKYGIGTNFGRGMKSIHIIDNTTIGVKKSILLVKVPGKHLLIGVTNDRINLITEIENKDVVDNETLDKPGADKGVFLNLMKKSYMKHKEKQ